MKTFIAHRAGGPRKFFQVLLCGAAALLWAVAGAANPALGNYPNRTKTTGRPDASPAFTESSDGKQDRATGNGGRFNLSIFLRQRPAAFSIVNVTHHEDKPGATTSYVFTSTKTGATTPAAIPAQALNISTRLRVDIGDKVMIGGFIIRGNASKAVVLRGLGPSLTNFGIPLANVFLDPVLELHGPCGTLIASNDNWKDSPQRAQIEGTGFQPSDDRESVILATLPPGAYTVILKGVGQTAGIGLIEVYDNNQLVDSDLANISTRGFVLTGDNVMIGGFALGGSNNPTRIAVRALGPSLTSSGLSNVLADPTLELHNANGTIMVSNDDWQSDPVSAAQLTANGLALPNPKESGIFTSLAPPGQFTAVVAGKNGGIGIGLVEIYDLDGSGTPAPAQTPCPPSPTPGATPTPTPTATPTPTPGPAGTCTENFDGVTAPALPPGWVASNAAGSAPLWVTSPTTPDTAPNDAVVKDSPEISDKLLDTPGIALTSASAQLSFRNNFSLQDGFDGGVLEVSSPNIAGGAFTDITNAAVGGSFVSGGYTGTISSTQGSPVAGRMAWTGNSGGYISTVVNMGPNVQGQTIKLRFHLATDQAVASGGWRIDTISIVGGTCP